METQTENKTTDIPGNELAAHIVQAVTGFFKSISLKNENALQDTLRLLTLWFKYGAHDEVSHAMTTEFTSVEVDTWLEVIPQVCLDRHSVASNWVLNQAQQDHSTNSDTQHQHS
jgi:FKBP12-rapamycin complex-associated protein